MKSSTELMRDVNHELMWGSGLWFLWGIGSAVGKWLGIETLKMDRMGALLWFGFGGFIALGIVVADCTKAVLAAIREDHRLL